MEEETKDKVMYKKNQLYKNEQEITKSSEDQIEDLRRMESDLLEKEYQIDSDLTKVIKYYESVENEAHKMYTFLDELAFRYSPQNGFEEMREEFFQNLQSFRENFEEDSEALKKKKREISEEYDKVYHKRIRIANNIEYKRSHQ